MGHCMASSAVLVNVTAGSEADSPSDAHLHEIVASNNCARFKMFRLHPYYFLLKKKNTVG